MFTGPIESTPGDDGNFQRRNRNAFPLDREATSSVPDAWNEAQKIAQLRAWAEWRQEDFNHAYEQWHQTNEGSKTDFIDQLVANYEPTLPVYQAAWAKLATLALG